MVVLVQLSMYRLGPFLEGFRARSHSQPLPNMVSRSGACSHAARLGLANHSLAPTASGCEPSRAALGTRV